MGEEADPKVVGVPKNGSRSTELTFLAESALERKSSGFLVFSPKTKRGSQWKARRWSRPIESISDGVAYKKGHESVLWPLNHSKTIIYFHGSPSFKSAELLFLRSKFPIYQSFKSKAPVFRIGVPEPIEPKTYPNPVKVALRYKEMLGGPPQAELARELGVSLAKVTQMLNLLKLDEEVLEFVLGLDEGDERLRVPTERRLRSLVQMSGGE